MPIWRSRLWVFGTWAMLVCMTASPDDTNALAAEWDERYAGLTTEMRDAEPNAVLITEVSKFAPGRALDIGCGVGAEAIWLASREWDVTALDVSRVALARATARGRQAGVRVNWVRAALEDAPLRVGGYDLVTAFYPALRHSSGRAAEESLLAAVAPGGTLLVVHHADVDAEKAKPYGFDPADYLSHDDIATLLDGDWHVRVDRRQPRKTPARPELQHTHDDVLLARRLR